MKRFAIDYLKQWKTKSARKPLVMRGARQVGKSYLVQAFAKENFPYFVEVNLERDPDSALFFTSHKPTETIQLLKLRYKIPIEAGKTLLFIDEIQIAPHVLVALRYFYEMMPDLHIIAAGSLLDFALRDPDFSVPVGRIEYLYLGPMHFEEFLLALGEETLFSYLRTYEVGQEILRPLHCDFMERLRLFLTIGGMPAAVQAYLDSEDVATCEEIKHSILNTYEEDFAKYGKRVDVFELKQVFRKLPSMVGEQLKYVRLDPHALSRDIAKALELLGFAHVVHKICHSDGNGVPLGAEPNDKRFKMLFLDVGLVGSICGLGLLTYKKDEDVALVNRGAIAEQFIGQELLYSTPFYMRPDLYYWHREKKGAAAEVDYLIPHGSMVIPVEVKSGRTGTLRSLHLFLKEKQRAFALRFNSEPPSFLKRNTLLHNQETISLLSLPHYLVGETDRLLKSVMGF